MMIFAVETEERSLYVFESEAEAVANCEGLDVESALWLFWDERGSPLKPLFTVPNKRGIFRVKNGVYCLVLASDDHHARLDEALPEIMSFEGVAPLDTAQGICDYLKAKRF